MLTIDELEATPVFVDHLEVSKGITALAAPSGTGKSRLFRAIADLVVNTGRVRLGEVDRAQVNAPEWRRLVRYVSAEPAWWLPTVRAHFSSEGAAGELADTFGLTPDLFNSPIEQLSSGERQRFGLVRALLDNPPLLLLDEPTAALDDATARKVEAELMRRGRDGCIVLLISHSEAQIKRVAERVLTIAAGQIVEAG